MENEPKLEKKTYYAIKKGTKDYNDLNKYKNVVDHGSFKHKRIFLNSKLVVSSHLHPKFYSPFSLKTMRRYRDLVRYKFAFVQHGVIYNDVNNAVNKFSQTVDLFITSTKAEHDEISQLKYMYESNEVVLTGLPRFDLLKDSSTDRITIMTTWRRSLTGPVNERGFHDKVNGFEDSEFYLNYKRILTSENLIRKLRESNYNIDFVLHPGFHEYYEDFKDFENDVIHIHDPSEVDYREVMCNSKLLITDFSSVFFDFATMKKPIIYFHFDYEEFYESHYNKGYFDFERDGFGPVCSEVDCLLEQINSQIDSEFKLEEKYLQRVNDTFEHLDQNNSKRVLEEINKMFEE